MKPNRPRIFIVGKIAQALKGGAQQDPKKDRVKSRRRSLFKAVVDQVSSKQKKEKYEYKLGGHIHVESVGTFLNCDLIGNGSPDKRRSGSREERQVKIKEEGDHATAIKTSGLKQANNSPICPLLTNEEKSVEPLQNQSFSTPARVRIFSANVQPAGRISTLSCSARRNIFHPHLFQAHSQPHSLHASRSTSRRRIFSTDSKSKLPAIHPLLPEKVQEHNLAPLQATIKQEDELSRITEVVHEAAFQSRLPNTNSSQY